MTDLALRSAAFHRELADAIVRVWRERLEAFGLPVPADTERFVRPGDLKLPGEPGLVTWAPKSPGDRPALSTVAEMTAAIAHCYDALLVTRPPRATANLLALWVVAVAELGGVARHVLDATRVGIPGWRVTVLCPEGPLAEQLRAQGTPVLTAAISPEDLLAAGVAAVRRAVQALQPTLVHSHLAYSDFLVAGATVGVPTHLVTTEHGIAGDDLVYHGTRLRSRMMELAHSVRLRRFDALIAVSRATSEAVQRKWHPTRTFRTVVIPNGVDPAPTPPPPPASRFQVVSLSRLAPEKGLGDLVEAFALVHAVYPDARLTIAGEGTLNAELSSKVADLGLREAVSLPGYIEANDIQQRSDVLCQLSIWENCSYALLDATGQSVCVVATDVGGNSEIPDLMKPVDWSTRGSQQQSACAIPAGGET